MIPCFFKSPIKVKRVFGRCYFDQAEFSVFVLAPAASPQDIQLTALSAEAIFVTWKVN